MSDTQEDVRHHLDCPKCGRRVRGHKVYVTGNADHRDDGHFRICPKCNTRFREVKPPDKRLTRLAAYEALGSVEYLAALVEEHEAYTANLEALDAVCRATRDEVNEAAKRNREANARFLAAHDEAEEVLRNG